MWEYLLGFPVSQGRHRCDTFVLCCDSFVSQCVTLCHRVSHTNVPRKKSHCHVMSGIVTTVTQLWHNCNMTKLWHTHVTTLTQNLLFAESTFWNFAPKNLQNQKYLNFGILHYKQGTIFIFYLYIYTYRYTKCTSSNMYVLIQIY